MPAAVAATVRAEYAGLGGDVSVAVRSSAVGEDSAETSYAGMNASFTNVRGADAVARRGGRVLGLGLRPRGRSPTGRAPGSDGPARHRRRRAAHGRRRRKAGVAFTADPVSGRRDRIAGRGRVGAGRGRRERPGRARHLRARRRRAAAARVPPRHPDDQKIVAAPGGGDRTAAGRRGGERAGARRRRRRRRSPRLALRVQDALRLPRRTSSGR